MLKIETYLEWSKKEELINRVLDFCIEETNGIYRCDSMKKEFYFCVYVVANYSDYPFEVDEENKYTNLVEDFDKIMKSGIYKTIIEKIDNDYFYLQERLEEAIQYKLMENSVESILGRIGMQIIDRIDKHLTPKGIAKIVKSIEKINPEMANLLKSINK